MDSKLSLYGSNSLTGAGENANAMAASFVLAEFKARRSENTVEAYKVAMQTWGDFLLAVGIDDQGDFFNDLHAWQGLTWGIVEAFKAWMLQQGMAINTINLKLSCVKVMAQLAHKSGIISRENVAQIAAVEGYYGAEMERIDNNREVSRISNKKTEPVFISETQADGMKLQPDTPQGHRDQLIMCLLLDHGLRASEVIGLQVENIDLNEGTLSFYRQKVSKTQTHLLSDDTKYIAEIYLNDIDGTGALIRSSVKGGALNDSGISRRGLYKRVKMLGERVGIDGLSPHDCRHYWTTYWATQDGINPFKLREAGGWVSFSTVQRYVNGQRIANKDMIIK